MILRPGAVLFLVASLVAASLGACTAGNCVPEWRYSEFTGYASYRYVCPDRLDPAVFGYTIDPQ